MGFMYTITDHIQSLLHLTWNWFGSLSINEWFVVLGIGASLGFLCMRGYGSRFRV